jgi:hypothetical protein
MAIDRAVDSLADSQAIAKNNHRPRRIFWGD